MISPFFPWFLAFLLLIACVALLVLLLRYRDRSVRLEAESRSWQERAEDRTQMLRRAEEVLKDSFAGISAEVLRNSEKQFLNLAETRLQSQRQQANHDLDSRKQAIESMLKPVSESLKLVQSRLGEMEKERVGAYTDLKTQIRYILSGNEALKNETARLSQALHHNSVRGQWGELQLRRVVELAGMVEYCDFTTQETRSREEERVRPDMVIHLPGGRSIIIDAKAPMASYLNAGQTENPEEHSQWMARHAADVKRHLQQLSAKNYFAQFSPCPEFVIMFLPGESFFQAALEADPSLIEFGAENKVILSTPSTLIALLVCLIPTTIGGLLSAIGIAGMDRVTRFNVIAMSGKAVEACGDVDTMILDKTGTITYGNRLAADFYPVGGASKEELIRCAVLTSLRDGTPEGKSTVELGRKLGCQVEDDPKSSFIEFSAQTRMSGVDLPDGTIIRKGAADAIEKYVTAQGGKIPAELRRRVDEVSSLGGTPLTVCEGSRILGVIYLKDTVKPGMVERFERLRAIGIKTIMCTGDNPLTAATIAKEAGVDGFIAECKPEDKITVIKQEQAEGKIVAMTGDGTNDAPALAQANVGLAMNSGTTAAKEAANMVDLDSDPTKILEVVEIGKQLLITRGSLTTFSIANDIAKYFAIIPAMFMLAIPEMGVLNIMGLASPTSAILSALIFNAIIIPCLIPLAMKGVKYRPMSSSKMLVRNLMIYGVGGIITPFVGIKIIDLIISPLLEMIGFIGF